MPVGQPILTRRWPRDSRPPCLARQCALATHPVAPPGACPWPLPRLWFARWRELLRGSSAWARPAPRAGGAAARPAALSEASTHQRAHECCRGERTVAGLKRQERCSHEAQQFRGTDRTRLQTRMKTSRQGPPRHLSASGVSVGIAAPCCCRRGRWQKRSTCRGAGRRTGAGRGSPVTLLHSSHGAAGDRFAAGPRAVSRAALPCMLAVTLPTVIRTPCEEASYDLPMNAVSSLRTAATLLGVVRHSGRCWACCDSGRYWACYVAEAWAA